MACHTDMLAAWSSTGVDGEAPDPRASSPASTLAYSRGWSSFHMPHLRKMASARPSAIAARSAAFTRSQKGRVGREQPDIVAGRDRRRGVHETRIAAHAPRRHHRVEQHGIHAAEREIGVRVHVVLVGDHGRAVLGRFALQDVEGQRGSQRGHAAACQIGERAVRGGIGLAHREDLAERVVRHGHRQAGAPHGRVLDATQARCRNPLERRPRRGS